MIDTIEKLDTEKKAKATTAVMDLAEKNGGTITPEIILDEARRKKSPLHSFFCWDNNAAAEQYRRIQAQQLIRRIKVTITGEDSTQIRVRAFVNVVEPNDEPEPEEIEGHGINARPRGVYVRFEDAQRIGDYHEQIMRQCARDVEAFRSKYYAFGQAAKIIAAMDEFTSTTAMH